MEKGAAWPLSPLLREEVAVAPETGLYASESEFVAEAIRTLLAARPDVQLAIACKLYEREAISLTKASELSNLDVEAMKEALRRHGVSRVASEDPPETEAMAQATQKAARPSR